MAISDHLTVETNSISVLESEKRSHQKLKRPRVFEKIEAHNSDTLNGSISPILRLKINRSACNMQCQHCCEEPYMTRDLIKRTGKKDPRVQMELADYKKLSEEADEYGIFRFVITGGEALLDRNLGDLIDTLDPYKHLIILDSNGWYFDDEKAKWFADKGGYKVQISLDSMNPADHDAFRRKPGAHAKALRAFKAAKKAGLQMLLSSCLIKDRVFTEEFEEMMAFCAEEEIPLYLTLAKPVGSGKGHDEWVCTKKDVDQLKFLEDKHQIFTHMTPSYGHPGKCITVKGINTVNHDGEIMPCPFMDMSLGNVTKEPLSLILDRGMKNKWLGPYRDECIIGENWEFIKFHNDKVNEWSEETPYLPVPYEKGFALTDKIPE